MNANILQTVVVDAKSKTTSPRWRRAIDRAAAGLLSGELIVTTLEHGAIVTSPNGTYHVNGHCECKAAERGHRECYHRAAARLVELIEAAPATNPARYCGDRDLQHLDRCKPHITRSVERDRSGARVKVVRCDGWLV